MQIRFTKKALVRRARERTSGPAAVFGPTDLEVVAFMALCGGKSADITVQYPRDVPDTLVIDSVLDAIAERVLPYTGMGAFMACRVQAALEEAYGETGHREHEVVGLKCFDNNGVLHVEVCTRNTRRRTTRVSLSRWNVTRLGVAVNVDDPLVGDCIREGGIDLPMTRLLAGDYPEGDHCAISNAACHGTDEKE